MIPLSDSNALLLKLVKQMFPQHAPEWFDSMSRLQLIGAAIIILYKAGIDPSLAWDYMAPLGVTHDEVMDSFVEFMAVIGDRLQ